MKSNQRNMFLLVVFGLFALSCGINMYESFMPKDSDRYHLAEARIKINNKEYAEAEDLLSKVENSSNEKVLLEVGAKLGKSGLSMWEILLDVVDDLGSGSADASGADTVFNLFTDAVFGTGDKRDERLQALDESIRLLRTVPEQSSKVDAFRCFLTGIFILPVVNDASGAMVSVTTALTDLQSSVSGSGSSSSECPGIDEFQLAMDRMDSVREGLDFILSQTADCSILDTLGDGQDLNEMAKKLKKFSDNADQGCPSLTCTDAVCQALQLGCVSSLLSTDSAVAGDGQVDSCEFLFNCKSPTDCF